MKKLFVLLFLPIFLFPQEDGALDITFNPNGPIPGTNIFDVNMNFDSISRIAIQPDGKIVGSGTTFSFGPINADWIIMRYKTNGVLDTTFNPSGIGSQPGSVILDFGGTFDQANAITVQPDGKIVVAGSANPPPGIQDFFVARLNNNGSLDTTFNPSGAISGIPGVVRTSFTSDDNLATGVVIQTDGKIVVGGYASSPTDPSITAFLVARYNTDGTLDTSFNATGSEPGKLTVNFISTDFDFALDLALQADGKIVQAGYTNPNPIPGPPFQEASFAFARYNTDGTLDTTLNPDSLFGPEPGKVTLDFGVGTDDTAFAVTIAPNGKIILAGSSGIPSIFSNPQAQFAFARFNVDGSLDTTLNPDSLFGPFAGAVVTNFNNATFSQIRDVGIQPFNKIVVVGRNGPLFGSQFVLARYNFDGSLDTTFNPNGSFGPAPGKVITSFGDDIDDIAFGMAIQEDGKIVAAGLSTRVNTNNDFVIARYFYAPPDPLSLAISNKYSPFCP